MLDFFKNCIIFVEFKTDLAMLFQANILAKYRPMINITLLIPELKKTEDAAAKTIAHFKNTRHIVLYYEDLVNNRTVRLAC